MNVFSLNELVEWAMAAFIAWVLFGVTAVSGVDAAGPISDAMFVIGCCFSAATGKEIALQLIRERQGYFKA